MSVTRVPASALALAEHRVEATGHAYAEHLLSCPSLNDRSQPCHECFGLCRDADNAASALGWLTSRAAGALVAVR